MEVQGKNCCFAGRHQVGLTPEETKGHVLLMVIVLVIVLSTAQTNEAANYSIPN